MFHDDDLIAEVWKNRFIWLSTQRNELDLKVVVMAWWFARWSWWVEGSGMFYLAVLSCVPIRCQTPCVDDCQGCTRFGVLLYLVCSDGGLIGRMCDGFRIVFIRVELVKVRGWLGKCRMFIR